MLAFTKCIKLKSATLETLQYHDRQMFICNKPLN